MAQLSKPPEQRLRRNKDQPGWTPFTDRDVIPEDERPKFPGRKPPAAAKRYWDSIWSSPMARMYLGVDEAAIARLCRLHAKDLNGDATASELTILQQLEDRYGLSPKARRQLQWDIERAAGPGAASEEQPADRERAKRDRRQRLSVVT